MSNVYPQHQADSKVTTKKAQSSVLVYNTTYNSWEKNRWKTCDVILFTFTVTGLGKNSFLGVELLLLFSAWLFLGCKNEELIYTSLE